MNQYYNYPDRYDTNEFILLNWDIWEIKDIITEEYTGHLSLRSQLMGTLDKKGENMGYYFEGYDI